MDLYTLELSSYIKSSLESCFFPSVKLGISSVAPKVHNSPIILKPQSASIQSSIETLVKKT